MDIKMVDGFKAYWPNGLFLWLLLTTIIANLSAQEAMEMEKEAIADKPCGFDCIHGRCDIRTRTCVCLHGWLGAGCDLCPLGMACTQAEPRLALILPQAGPILLQQQNNNQNDSPPFVYAHGSGFPKGQNGHYTCLFGSAESSQGQWLSSSLIRCPLPSPARLEPAKLAFSLVPANSNAFIPYEQEWGTSHFTFYTPCQQSNNQCRGTCLGPLCLCSTQTSGQYCEQANLTTLNGTLLLESHQLQFNDSMLGTALEFSPYIAKLPVESDSIVRISLNSDFEGLQLDPFQGIVYWPSPLGQTRPYSIAVGIDHLDGSRQQLNWSLRVRPTYFAEIGPTLVLANGTNAREVTGKVQWEQGAKVILNGSIPLLLHISAIHADHSTSIEDIPIWTEPEKQTFKYLLFPYLEGTDKLAISVRHPGMELEQHLHEQEIHGQMKPLEFVQERVEVHGFPAELVADEHFIKPDHSNESEATTLLALNYSLRLAPLNGDCLAGWRFEILEPRELLSLDSAEVQTNGRQVQLRLRSLVNWEQMRISSAGNAAAAGLGLNLRIAFICMPTGQNVIVRQTLKDLKHPTPKRDTVEAELNPKRLYFDRSQSQTATVLPLDIRLPLVDGKSNRQRQLERSKLERASFGPFNLIWISHPPESNEWRLWLALKDEEENVAQSGGPSSDNTMDGALLIPGAENFALSVPYRIQQQLDQNFMFTLTIKSSGAANFYSSANADWQHTDVELFSQSREQHFVRTLLLNTPEQFGPLRADIFQLRVNSRLFLPYSKLFRINPLDNAFIVELKPRPAQYFTHDGHRFEAEWEQGEEWLSQSTVQIRPSVFTSEKVAQYVEFVYTHGPPGSFAFVRPDWPPAGMHSIPLASANGSSAGLCLGCGFRQRIHLQSPKMANSDNNYAATVLSIPFWATMPRGSSLPEDLIEFYQHLLWDYGKGTEEENEEEMEMEEASQDQQELPSIYHQPTITSEEKNEADQLFSSPQVALRTRIHRNCALTRLRRCRRLFRFPGLKCQRWWHQMPDDLLSVHSLAQFALLSMDCRREGSGPEEQLALVECIERVNKDCPLHPVEAEMAPHQGGQLFNQMGYVKSFRSGLESLFPALSEVESQLVSFPTVLADFHHQLNAIFPLSLMAPLAMSTKFYDQFVTAIGSESPNGTLIEWPELDVMLGDSRDPVHRFIQRWNSLVHLLEEGNRLDLLEPGTEAHKTIEQFRQLVQSADRLKSVTRQFGSENPFSMFRDVLGQIFANVAFPHQQNSAADGDRTTAEGDWHEQLIGWADVRVQPQEPVEGEEFRVFANVQTRQLILEDLTGLQLDLRFKSSASSPSATAIKFRIGPVLFISGSAGIDSLGQQQQEPPLRLDPGQRLRVDWTILPVPEFRQTEPIKQELELILAFELAGQRHAHRLRVPPIQIHPRPSLRLLTFAYPTVSLAQSAGHRHHPFSLLISAINSGYSPLKSVQFHEFRPQLLLSNQQNRPANFRISSVRMEPVDWIDNAAMEQNEIGSNGEAFTFGQIPSGKAAHLAVNLSLINRGNGEREIAFLRNFSAVVSVNGGQLLPPGQFDQRFFLIQDVIRHDHSMLIVSEHQSLLPLYLFSKQDNSLTPLTTLQLIEEKEARPILNGHAFLTRAFALRRLAIFPIPNPPSVKNGTSSQMAGGAILASLSVDTAETFADGAKLLYVAEIGAQGRQRPVDLAMVWIGQRQPENDGKATLINFIDTGASPAVPQLIYELLFGRPEHFRAPFFGQPLYQLHLAGPIVPVGQQVLARISAISPLNRAVNYTLWSREKESPFSIVPSTGDLILSQSLPGPSEYCLNLGVKDQEGHGARVPLEILVVNGLQNGPSAGGTSCQLFPPETPQFDHEFEPVNEVGDGDGEDTNWNSNSNGDLLIPMAQTSKPIAITVEAGVTEKEEEEEATTNWRPSDLAQFHRATSTMPVLTTTSTQMAIITTTEAMQEIGDESQLTPMMSTQKSDYELATVAIGRWGIGGPEDDQQDLQTIGYGSMTTMATNDGQGIREDGGTLPSVGTSSPLSFGPNDVEGSVESAELIGGFSITTKSSSQFQESGKFQSTSAPAAGFGRPSVSGQRTSGSGFSRPKPSAIQKEDRGGGSQANAQAMVEMACRMRAVKPIWALICDMAKTVYRTHMQNM